MFRSAFFIYTLRCKVQSLARKSTRTRHRALNSLSRILRLGTRGLRGQRGPQALNNHLYHALIALRGLLDFRSL